MGRSEKQGFGQGGEKEEQRAVLGPQGTFGKEAVKGRERAAGREQDAGLPRATSRDGGSVSVRSPAV